MKVEVFAKKMSTADVYRKKKGCTAIWKKKTYFRYLWIFQKLLKYWLFGSQITNFKSKTIKMVFAVNIQLLDITTEHS